MKENILMILFLGCLVNHAHSQVQLERRVVASGGGHTSGAGIILSYTIGEPATLTLSGSAAILTQGFQQPGLMTVGFNEPPSTLQHLNIFPNPVYDLLNICLQSPFDFEAEVAIFDLTGRLVLPSQIFPVHENTSEIIRLDLQSLAPAAYLIRISDAQHRQPLNNTGIIKTH